MKKIFLILSFLPLLAISQSKDPIPLLDSTIIINISPTVKSTINSNLTVNNAKMILYEFFKLKGFCIDEQFVVKRKKDYNNVCIRFDTAYFAYINKDEAIDAIVSYWIAPPHASGHCFQPEHALILSNATTYNVMHEDFIPDSFSIERIEKGIDFQTFIFGFDYNCAENKIVRTFKISLK